MLLGGFKLGFFGLIILRLIYLQIWQYRKYLNLSALNRYRIVPLPAVRGKIIDRNNVEIAYNRISYRALFDPTVTEDKEIVMRDFFKLCSSKLDSQKFIKHHLEIIKIYNIHTPLVLNSDLTYDEIARIEFNREYMPGIWVEKSYMRIYPFKEYFASIVGYVSKPTPFQMKDVDQMERRLYKESSFKIGQIGIEAIKEKKLRGDFGIILKEVNAAGKAINQINHSQAINGKNIKLTIDTRLQTYVSQMLNGVSGAIIISDIKTSEILAMQSSPSFDPNEMVKGMDHEMWKKLNDPKLGYLSNKTIYGTYMPGSTFKPVTVLSALINGFDPNRTIHCNGEIKYGDRVFHCHKKEGHGSLNMTEALACSCNIYFYNMGMFLDITKLSDTAKMLGFGEYVNLGIGKESKGLIPTLQWKEQVFKQKWLSAETLMVGIGQTYLNVTLMQLNNMNAAIASGLITTNKIFYDNKLINSNALNIKEEYLNIVRKGLRMAFTHPYGTSRSGAEYQQKYEMAGKTGTAQVVSKRFTIKEMLSGEIPKSQLPHALYAGYAPFSDPKFSVVAMIEHGMYGPAALRYAEKAIAKAMDLRG